MRKKEQIKRFNLSIVSICLFVIMCIGVAYAVFSYNRLGNNNEFIMGRVYLNFFENANIALEDALPENASSARNNHGKKIVSYNGRNVALFDNELLFSLDGVNESNRDFYFDFYLNEGDSIDGRERIDPKYVRYDLVRVNSDGTEETLINNNIVGNLKDNCFYSDILSAYDELPSTMYKIRMWISNEVTWGDNGLYTYEEFENLYFSAKLSVNGDYSKTIKSLSTGEIEDEIGNMFAPLVYEIEFEKISTSEYLDYFQQFIGVASYGNARLTQIDNSEVIRSIGDGVFEIYTRNDNGTYNLRIVSDSKVVLPEDCSNLFTKFTNLRRITLDGVDTSQVTNMSGMFKNLEHLYRVDLSPLDTSNVTTMKEMFANSGIFDVNLGSIDISSVTDSSYMFYNCLMLSKIYCDPEANINFGNVTTKNDMVTNDTYLSGIIYRNSDNVIFYSDSKTDGSALNSSVSDQWYFTYNKASIKNYELSTFYIGQIDAHSRDSTVTNLEFILLDKDTMDKLYTNASYKTTITQDVCAVTYSNTTFIISDGKICTGYDANGFISTSRTASTSYSYTYDRYGTSVHYERINFKNLDISGSNIFYKFFGGCGKLKYIDFDSLNFSNATTYFQMFLDCAKIEFIDFYYLNAPNVTDFGEMFWGCTKLKYIDLIIFDISGATGYRGIGGFVGFTGVDIYDPESIDLNLIDTSKCTSLYGFFAGLLNDSTKTLTLPDHFVHSGINDLSYIFNCTNLISWNFDNCDFSGVTSLDYAFSNNTAIQNITREDLSFLENSRIANFNYIFQYCSALKSVDLSGIAVDTVSSSSSVYFNYTFINCSNLLSVKLPKGVNSSDYFYFNGTFEYCGSIENIDLSNLGNGSVQSFYYTFYDCYDLKNIQFGNLRGCTVDSLNYTFYCCYDLEYLDFYQLFNNTGWSTSSSYSLDHTFYDCQSLKYLDLRGFLTSGNGNISLSNTFYYCYALEKIVVPYEFFTRGLKANSGYQAFYSNNALVGGSGTAYSYSCTSSSMFRPDGLYSDYNGGYLTVDWSYHVYDFSSSSYNRFNTYMATVLNNFFKAKFSSNSLFQSSSNYVTFKICYCDSSLYSNITSIGASLYSENGGSFYYFLSTSSSIAGTLTIYTDKPLYFQSGTGSTYSSSVSILRNMVYGTSATQDCFKEIVFDALSYNNLSLSYFMYDTNIISFMGLTGQTVGSADLYNTFAYAYELQSIDLRGYSSGGGSSSGMTNVFYYCYDLSNIKMDFMSISSVTSSYTSMLYNTGSDCTSVSFSMFGATIYSLDSQFFYKMFNGYSKTYSKFDVRNLKMSYIRSGFLNSVPGGIVNLLDFSNWRILYTTNLDSLFYNTTLSSYDSVNSWTFNSQVTSMASMFQGCSYVTSIAIPNFDVSRCTNFDHMFQGCSSLMSLNIKNWDVSSGTKFDYMFNGLTSLEILYIDNWKTSSAESFEGMFQGCVKLTSLDVSGFDTSNVLTLHATFNGCEKLLGVDVANWDTSSCTNFDSMFGGCNKIENFGNDDNKLNWDTSKVTSFANMFRFCNAIEKLDLSSFDTSNVTSFNGMFENVTHIVNMDMSNWTLNANTLYSLSIPILSYEYSGDSILKIRNLDMSSASAGLTDGVLNTIISFSFYKYIDASGWKLPTETEYLGSVFQDIYDLKGLDISNWVGWDHIIGFDNTFIISVGGPFISTGVTIWAEAGLDLTDKILVNDAVGSFLSTLQPNTPLVVYQSGDYSREVDSAEYCAQTSTVYLFNKTEYFKTATNVHPVNGYFSNSLYRVDNWYE